MRCLALSAAWQESRGRSVFVGVCDSQSLRTRVRAIGADFVSLQDPHPAAADMQETLSAARDFRADWVVLDGYHFDSTYQERIRATGCRLIVIDDMCHVDHYFADVILNQDIGADELPYNCEPGTVLLLGPRYALLRPEFRVRQPGARVFDHSGKRVLITLGGSDPGNVASKVAKAFKELSDLDLELRFVIGPSNPHAGTLASEVSALKGPAEIVVDPPDMSELMAWADLAVSAAGSTCWELAFMGTPAVVIVVAQNQIRLAKGLSELGVVKNMGWANQLTASALATTMRVLLASGSQLTQMSRLGQALVDAEGVHRVIKHLKGP